MIKAFASVASKFDKTTKLDKALRNLAKTDVYVGIPEGDTGGHEGITNAQLMYVHTHGIRTKAMQEEMNDYMGLTPNGMPIMRDFNTFSNNLTGGMAYSAAYELYIHEHGSPLWRIPPRPVLEPAISHNKEMIAKQLKQASISALGESDPTDDLHKAGMAAVNAAKNWFYNPENRWPPNSEETVKQKGSDRPLVDTGQLRNSITYVVAKKT